MASTAPWHGFVAGASAATCAGCVTHPIDLVKVRMQLSGSQIQTRELAAGRVSVGSSGQLLAIAHRPSPLGIGLSVVRQEGVAALYRGLTASILRQGMFVGSRFAAYDVFMAATRSHNGPEGVSFVQKAACGMAAGVVGACVGNPFDLAMVRMQSDNMLPKETRRGYRNGLHAVSSIVREEGLFALWTGVGPTMVRSMVVAASQLVKELIQGSTGCDDAPPPAPRLIVRGGRGGGGGVRPTQVWWTAC